MSFPATFRWFALLLITMLVLVGRTTVAEVVTSSGDLLTDDVTTEMHAALSALRSGDVAKCRELAATVVAKSDRLPHADVLVAKWLVEVGRTDLACQLLESTALIEPPRPDIHHLFAQIAHIQGRHFDAWTHIKAAESAPAPANWSAEFREDWNRQVRTSKGLIAEQRGDWKTARALLMEVPDAPQRPADVSLALGRAAFHLGSIAEAEAAFRSAAQAGSGQYVPELLIIRLFAQQGDDENVESWFAKGDQESNPNRLRIRLAHARWRLSKNQPAKAIELATTTESTADLEPEFNLICAVAEQMQGNHADAERTLARLHQRFPQSLPVSNQLLLALVESPDEGKRGRALQIATTNAKTHPRSADALASLAWVQYRLGDLLAARQISAAILKAGTRLNRDSCYYLAQILERTDQSDDAKTLLEASQQASGEFLNGYRLNQ